ncbi:MAG: hypothetical protein QXN59_02220 [Candidatus Micrarchaeaceae archaeon]
MASKKAKAGANNKGTEEPVFVVKRATKLGGLDYIHISLIVLVVILIALSFALSVYKENVIIKNCEYGISNSTCIQPKYNQTQVIEGAERALAAYSSANGSISIVPYYSLVNQSTAAYIPSTADWLVSFPYIDPLDHNKVFNASMLINGSTLALEGSFLGIPKPSSTTSNMVVAKGAIEIAGKSACNTTEPIPVYSITDPYAYGALNSLRDGINASQKFGNKVNVSYYFIYTDPSIALYGKYGIGRTQALGEYLFCASKQSGHFSNFTSIVQSEFYGTPLLNITLNDTAIEAGMNMTSFDSCLNNSAIALDYQAKLAAYYGVTQTPTYIVNCMYQTLPETLDSAINYSIDTNVLGKKVEP